MGINYNPRGVSEGLIYYIDPYNNRSYSGNGNTVYNLVNASIGGTFVGSTASPIDSTSTRTFFMSGSNYINCPNNIPLTNNFTVSVWFKLNAYVTGSIINKWYADNSNAHRSWIMSTDTATSKMLVILSSDGTYTNPTIKRYSVAVNLNEYTNLTFTFATGTLTVYKNGTLATVTKELDASFTTVYDNPTRPIQVGYFYDFSNSFNQANVGIAQIYNRVLSPTEILQNYDATKKRYYPEENIVRDGLILNLDPGNSRSYAGAGNTIYDLSGFGNTGTLTNGPTFSSLNSGSLVFDGTNDYTTIPHNSSQNLTYITVSAWFNFPTVPFSGLGINKEGSFRLMSAEAYTSTASGRLGGSWGTGVGPGSTTLKPNKWYQIVMTADGTTQKLYVNGTLDYSANNSALASVNSNVLSFATYHFGASNFMNCQISQTQIYNRALSPEEVLQNYNATKNRFINTVPPVRDNLVLNLDAGDLASYPGSGTTWFDLSGNGNNSSLVGSPTYTFNDSASFITFDANTKSGTLSTSILNNYSSGTIECSVFITNLTSSFILARQRNGFNSYSVFSIGSYADGGGTLVTGTSGIVYYHNKNAQTLLSSSTALLANTWYRLSITFTTSSVILYINGVQNATVAGDYSVPNDASTDPRIGAWIKDGVNYPMNGRLAQFQVYNRALSAAEIAQNFNFYRTRYGI